MKIKGKQKVFIEQKGKFIFIYLILSRLSYSYSISRANYCPIPSLPAFLNIFWDVGIVMGALLPVVALVYVPVLT